MGCTKHCEEHKQNDNGKMSCSKLRAPNKGILSLEDEIDANHVRISEMIKNGDYSTIIEDLFVDDCINVVNGQAPRFGKEDTKQEWFEYFGSNPSINRESFTTTAFGENTGMVWEDGIANLYQDDTLIGSERYMHVYKRVNGTLLRYIEIYW
ncbi:uncharacterized protein [Amphiura filiformis]|uniref:uncharacterized protein isoform X5 n=1 Tax=Amphiura filiformis TaxID=82378 RepID=UPI003B20E4AF